MLFELKFIFSVTQREQYSLIKHTKKILPRSAAKFMLRNYNIFCKHSVTNFICTSEKRTYESIHQ